MYFKRIEMHGFKSFAEPVTIEFDKGITCIVGPNGSGKSNISDAIRWVLGEQSPKMLRGGKMEEVIFSGTSSRKSRGMAEVTLVIDNEDGRLPIDYKEVAIRRRMFRSGESEYHINGSQCRLRDIRELIMDTGIGVEGYSLIGQGRISDIISNKTESRREIFEEAAGIVMYRTKKAESERKLASTRANLERLQDIIGEIEGRIDGLKEDSLKAREYIELRERYRELEINIILKNTETLELKNEYLKDELSELGISIDTARENRERAEKTLESVRERSAHLEKLSEEARGKLIKAAEDLGEAVNKSRIDEERLASIRTNTERLREEEKRLKERLEKETEGNRALAERKAETDRKAAALRKELEDKVSLCSSVEEEMSELERQANDYKNDILELSGAVNSQKAEINSLEMLQDTLEKRKESIRADRKAEDETGRETVDRLNKMKAERLQTEELLEEIRERIRESGQAASERREEERRLAQKAEALSIDEGKISARKKTIEEMENNYEGYNSAVRYVMKSGLRGIRGTVADLIKVPPGYETAIETALGASLQNIVCDDDESAKEAIEALKRNRAGRMTFLPVNSVRGRALRQEKLEGRRGFIGYGPQCVEYRDEYRGIIEYLLGRVVIVENMDEAVKLSKTAGSLRLVTLEGEVINTGGAITGGKYRNKTANILDRKAEIASLKQQEEEKKEEREQCLKELSVLRISIEDEEEKRTALEEEMRRGEREAMEKENEIRLTEKLLKDIKSGGDKLQRELENIKKEKENSREMIEKLNESIEEKNRRLCEAEELSQRRLEEYGRKKAEYEQISEEATKLRIDVNLCDSEKEHVDSMAESAGEKISEIKSDIEERREQLRRMEEERLELLSGGVQREDTIRRSREEKQRLEGYIEEISLERESLSEENSKAELEKKAVSEELERLQNRKYELELKSAKNDTQLETYKNKLWDDFEVSYIQAVEFKKEGLVMSSAVKENRQIKERIKELGEVNVGAIEEYETVKERYDFLTEQRGDILQAMENLTKIIEDMDKTIKVRFQSSFDTIVENFEENFKELFGGGHAELRLSDEKAPLESDIDIVAQPPGKKLQNINLLSGGEKTLTAIALMFAVLKAKPTPFCILDEVEAALDDANIDRFISCLRKFQDIQFALVTHQKATMEHADVLYGVTMPEKGVSKVLSLSLEEEAAGM